MAPIAGELLTSQVRPIFLARTLIWTTIPFYLAVAAGPLYLKQRSLRVLVIFLLVGLNLWGVLHYYRYFHRPGSWDRLADYVAQEVAPGDLILFYRGYYKHAFNYYFRKYDKDVDSRALRATALHAPRSVVLTEIEEQIRSLPPHSRFLAGL